MAHEGHAGADCDAEVSADCCEADDGTIETRSAASKPVDDLEQPAATAAAGADVQCPVATNDRGANPPPYPGWPKARLHALHCVYLD